MAVAIVAGTFIYVSSNRYVTASGADGRVYKVDKRTGEAVLLVGSKEIGVRPKANDEPTSDAEQAISLAKIAYTLRERTPNEAVIDELMKTMKGALTIQGWKAEPRGDEIHLVTYNFENNGIPKSVCLEVNLAARLVRNVRGDEELEKQYLGNTEPE